MSDHKGSQEEVPERSYEELKQENAYLWIALGCAIFIWLVN